MNQFEHERLEQEWRIWQQRPLLHRMGIRLAELVLSAIGGCISMIPIGFVLALILALIDWLFELHLDGQTLMPWLFRMTWAVCTLGIFIYIVAQDRPPE